MRILLAVFNDFKTYFNTKTKQGRRRSLILGVILLALIVAWQMIHNSDDATENSATNTLPIVTLRSVTELASDARFDTIGKVEAISEARLQAESGGQITSVSVKVGDSVRAGQVLATIENSAQRAALVQAQGAYEAALAGAAQSGVGVSEASTQLTAAQNNAINTFNTAFNTVNSSIFNTIDPFFSNPTGGIPGVKIDALGNADVLNTERIAFQQILPAWQQKSNTLSVNSNLDAELAYARTNIDRTIAMVDTFISLFNQSGKVGNYSNEELQGHSVTFTGLRATLIGTRSAIDGARASLTAAKDGVTRANLSAQGGQISSAGAQVKIALGALQAAQSQFQKTIIRTPIQGMVNALYLKTGEYVSPGMPTAIVANNGGLQIKTFVSEIDSANLTVGDTVSIEGGASGVITAKADALDPSNGKVAVVVGVNPDSNLTNGATVKVTFSQVSKVAEDSRILIPLSALKITPEGDSVFTVSEESILQAIKVEKGRLFGDSVEILSGITKETRIVTDARGLKANQEVTIK
jgi:RND family efflux transporter MFP subunit